MNEIEYENPKYILTPEKEKEINRIRLAAKEKRKVLETMKKLPLGIYIKFDYVMNINNSNDSPNTNSTTARKQLWGEQIQ